MPSSGLVPVRGDPLEHVARHRPARADPPSARPRGPRGRVGHQLQRDRRAVDHLAPPADVGRAREPVVPEPHGVIEQPTDLGHPHRARRPVGGRLQHHPAQLARLQFQAHPDVTVLDPGLREVGVGLPDDVQGEPHQVGAEHRAGVEQLGQVRLPSVVEPGRDVDREPHPTRTQRTIRTSRCVSVAAFAESGRYICRVRYGSSTGRTRKWPPRSWSSRAPNTLGGSKRGQQNQSTEPSVRRQPLDAQSGGHHRGEGVSGACRCGSRAARRAGTGGPRGLRRARFQPVP
jgi:hypothetical protein